jgi:hypothetical protein
MLVLLSGCKTPIVGGYQQLPGPTLYRPLPDRVQSKATQQQSKLSWCPYLF